jgi:hypothetical protein
MWMPARVVPLRPLREDLLDQLIDLMGGICGGEVYKG